MTDKEKQIENYRQQRQARLDRGYEAYEGIISIVKANVLALVTAGPFAALAAALYIMKWGGVSFSLGLKGVVLFVVFFLISIPIHEGIHGLVWGCFCKKRFKSIRFGIMKESGTPYCHCMEPLRFGGYILGCLAPFLILGIGLFLVSLFTQSSLLLLLSILNLLCAGGDTTIALMLLPHLNAEILDHPTDCVFVAFCKEKGEAQ